MLHEKYTHSAAIKQIFLIERNLSKEKMGEILEISVENLEKIIAGKEEMCEKTLKLLFSNFNFMNGKV